MITATNKVDSKFICKQNVVNNINGKNIAPAVTPRKCNY